MLTSSGNINFYNPRAGTGWKILDKVKEWIRETNVSSHYSFPPFPICACRRIWNNNKLNPKLKNRDLTSNYNVVDKKIRLNSPKWGFASLHLLNVGSQIEVGSTHSDRLSENGNLPIHSSTSKIRPDICPPFRGSGCFW